VRTQPSPPDSSISQQRNLRWKLVPECLREAKRRAELDAYRLLFSYRLDPNEALQHYTHCGCLVGESLPGFSLVTITTTKSILNAVEQESGGNPGQPDAARAMQLQQTALIGYKQDTCTNFNTPS
jgi:hypothetical protein